MFISLLQLLGLSAIALGQTFEANCSSLAHSLIVSTGNSITVNFANFVPAGTLLNLTATGNDPSCTRPSQAVSVDICRLAMEVKTSNTSSITMEAWMPKNYTGRFLSTGNGGLSGCIQYEDLAYTVQHGFSAVATNNGHNGTSGEAFLNHPEVIIDYSWRAVYTGVVLGKEITDQFYGKPHQKSYYIGCSTGGRQGFKLVQDFPDLFDGVIVGAPAIHLTGLLSESANFYRILGGQGSPTFLSYPQWLFVHDAILKQCDSLDGFKDGLIEDTDICQPNPELLLCPDSTKDSPTCLQPAQIEAVKQVFSDVVANGTFIYPRMNPGSEVISALALYNGQPFAFSADWFKYVVFNDTNYDATKFTLDDALKSIAQNPSDIDTFKGDISAARDHGTKILHWHGGADFLITHEISTRYYNHVLETMNTSSQELDKFYRYFRVSGGGHCGGGDGASNIGQSYTSFDTLHDNILLKIVDWVEDGNPPETIRGTKFVNDTTSLGVSFQRDHCRYPFRNMYGGNGTSNRAEDWKCVAPSSIPK